MDDPGSPSVLGSLVLILALTLINAFLAGAEMAFVSLNPAKIRELALPAENRKDVNELPEYIRNAFDIHYVTSADEVIDLALEKADGN